MNFSQRLLLELFLPYTAVILILDNFFPGASTVYYFKFITIFSLFLASCLVKKRHPEQILMNAAVFFALLGEFFLNGCDLLAPDLADWSGAYGALGFMLAYGLLILAFYRGAKAYRSGIVAALPVLLVGLSVLVILHPYIEKQLIWETLSFYAVLCCMAWCSILTLFGGYFGPGASRRIALAGFLILISDSGVAMAIFHPSFAGHFTPWLENIIWGAYVPAWTLIVFTMAGDDLLATGN